MKELIELTSAIADQLAIQNRLQEKLLTINESAINATKYWRTIAFVLGGGLVGALIHIYTLN